MKISQTTQSSEETIFFASSFAQNLRRGDVVALYGELGSGKTQFVKGLCRFYMVSPQVTSPTFVIMNRYDGMDKDGKSILVYHFDLYRISSLTEIYDLGYEEFLYSDGICVIEWAEYLGNLRPDQRYDIHFQFGKHESERRIEIMKVNQG